MVISSTDSRPATPARSRTSPSISAGPADGMLGPGACNADVPGCGTASGPRPSGGVNQMYWDTPLTMVSTYVGLSRSIVTLWKVSSLTTWSPTLTCSRNGAFGAGVATLTGAFVGVVLTVPESAGGAESAAPATSSAGFLGTPLGLAFGGGGPLSSAPVSKEISTERSFTLRPWRVA